jgi:hypothetical protein
MTTALFAKKERLLSRLRRDKVSLSFGLVVGWLFVAFYLAKQHKKALDDDSVVC